MQNAELKMQNAELKIENGEFRMRNAEFRMQNAKFRMQNTELKIQNTKSNEYHLLFSSQEMKSLFHHIKNAHQTFEHFHTHLHHAFVLIVGAIIGMIRGASNILTHSTSATRQRGGFLTNDFWNQNPSNANITYALFGDGTPGSTAYTRTRSTSCIPTNIVFISTGAGGSLAANTIYILTGGTYTFTTPLTFNGDCTALIGAGDVTINENGNSIVANNRNSIIIDNIHINGQNTTATGIQISNTINISLNAIDIYHTTYLGIGTIDTIAQLSNSRFHDNVVGVLGSLSSGPSSLFINNSHFYNNSIGLLCVGNPSSVTINNSQFSNNSGYAVLGQDVGGAYLLFTSGAVVNNSLFYNNKSIGLEITDSSTAIINNSKFYNNQTGFALNGTGIGYGTISFFGNSGDMQIAGGTFTTPMSSPIASRSNGLITTGTDTISTDRMTNPQNSSGQRLLNGTNRSSLRGTQTFDPTKTPIRYIFGLNIPKQIIPVRYHNGALERYGYENAEYFPAKYVAEPESALSSSDQALVDQYFGSGSLYTQNRSMNGCSLSAFQVVHLNPGTFSSPYNFQDHTIYILTGGEYRSSASSTNGFVFTGNCIAVIGTDSTIFTKSNSAVTNLFYANGRHNVIMDSLKIDGLYYATNLSSAAAKTAISMDGTSNNITLNDIQISNAARYGIFMGVGSHHATIMNAQLFNNGIAGIYLSYASNYNTINNTQTYNNGSYGIRFANGSSRNTMNNFQSYNNAIGVFGDLTSQENIINRAAIYNNSDAGISLKNTSGDILNNVRLFNNGIGIRTLYNSFNNRYYGELIVSDNDSNLDGTTANDSSLSPGNSGLFPYAGTLNTGSITASCLYTANPALSGLGQNLLDGDCTDRGYLSSFVSPYDSSVNYAFGLNMYKQKIPVRYDTGNILTEIPSQYDSGKYIAEAFAIRDDAPEGIYFYVSGSVNPSTRYTTEIYTAGTINIQVPVTLSFTTPNATGNLIISGHSLGLTGTVSNGDRIQLHFLSAAGFNQSVTGTITIGSVSTGFAIPTRDMSQTPTTGSFAFTNFTSIPVDTFTGSTVTVTGIETGVLAGITFDPSATSGRLEIYSGGTLVNSGTTGVMVYNGNQVKAIGQSSSGYAQIITGYVYIGAGTGMFTITTKGSDSTPPTSPVLTYPLSGEELFFITRGWTAATDTGSGIEGYVYEIAEDPDFIDVMNTGFIATTGTTGSPNTDFEETSDTFYRRMQARDRDGNVSARSNSGKFEAIDSDEWNFDDREDANLRTYYDSNEITIEGMKAGATLRASVDENGTLYKNGNDKGTGAYVQNGDDLYVTVRSSNRYDKTISTILTIANRELEFNVTTKEDNADGCTLSDDDETTIQDIFDSLTANYSGSEDKYDEFLYTMQSMLSDEIDFTNDCNLQYLEDLINDELGIASSGTIETGTHIAPNCKEYAITFDTEKNAYTSPNFTVLTYFANHDSLTKYIDSKNPGDCHINTYGVSSRIFSNTDASKHIASNGKIYTITNDGEGYTSTDFAVAKHFSTISALRSYIDGKNPAPQVWNHEVDTSFTPQTYTAPNGKEYIIYKTNKGYMSYKLLTIRYFSSLADIQAYIKWNNPK